MMPIFRMFNHFLQLKCTCTVVIEGGDLDVAPFQLAYVYTL